MGDKKLTLPAFTDLDTSREMLSHRLNLTTEQFLCASISRESFKFSRKGEHVVSKQFLNSSRSHSLTSSLDTALSSSTLVALFHKIFETLPLAIF